MSFTDYQNQQQIHASGYILDLNTNYLWRPTGALATAQLNMSQYPLRQGFTYKVAASSSSLMPQASVRAYYAIGASDRSGVVSTTVTVDTTPPVLFQVDSKSL